MGLVAILAFCAITSGGADAPIPPYECVWVENSEVAFETQTACVIEASRLRRDPIIRANAERMLGHITGKPNDKVAWYTWCHPEEDLKGFYRHFGVGDLGDIPEEA